FGIDRFEVLLENARTQHVRSLRGQVSSGDCLPRDLGPVGCGSVVVLNSERLARQIVKFILAARRIEQIRGKVSIVLDAFERDVETVQQTDSSLQIVNRLLDQTIRQHLAKRRDSSLNSA